MFVRLLGGLGNQLFQHAAGLAVAAETGRTLVFDDGLLIRDRLRRYALGRWGVDVPFERPGPALGLALRIPGLWRHLRRRGGVLRIPGALCVFDRMRGEPMPIGHGDDRGRSDRVGHDIVLTGYWQRREYFRPIEPMLRRTLAHRDAAALAPRIAELGLGPRTIAVHVRRGDYATSAVAAMNPTLPASYHRAAAAALCRERGFDRAVVFTDDEAWVRANLRLDLPWILGSAPDQAADDDLWLMSRAGGIVIANSSFSWWAAWLAEAHGAIVAAPRPWFGPRGRDFAHPAPDDWRRIDWSP